MIWNVWEKKDNWVKVILRVFVTRLWPYDLLYSFLWCTTCRLELVYHRSVTQRLNSVCRGIISYPSYQPISQLKDATRPLHGPVMGEPRGTNPKTTVLHHQAQTKIPSTCSSPFWSTNKGKKNYVCLWQRLTSFPHFRIVKEENEKERQKEVNRLNTTIAKCQKEC